VRVSILAILAAILASSACVLSAAQVPTATPTVSPPPASPTPTPAPTATERPRTTEEAADVQTATVRAALVNVRANPGGEVIGQVEAGQEVTVLETDGDWVRIEGGWIWGGCLVGSDRGCEAR
jgi:uncharacterized protein YgiM (DUF1202 family)